MRRRCLASTTVVVAMVALAVPAFANHGFDVDCGDFTFQEEAQAHFDAHPGDPDRLDQGGIPGVRCLVG